MILATAWRGYSSHYVESLVKQIGYCVRGTERFWNDGKSPESILQIRAAALNDDDRPEHHHSNRPGNPVHPNVKIMPAITTATEKPSSRTPNV